MALNQVNYGSVGSNPDLRDTQAPAAPGEVLAAFSYLSTIVVLTGESIVGTNVIFDGSSILPKLNNFSQPQVDFSYQLDAYYQTNMHFDTLDNNEKIVEHLLELVASAKELENTHATKVNALNNKLVELDHLLNPKEKALAQVLHTGTQALPSRKYSM